MRELKKETIERQALLRAVGTEMVQADFARIRLVRLERHLCQAPDLIGLDGSERRAAEWGTKLHVKCNMAGAY